MMDSHERDVYFYLKSRPGESVSEVSISRHAGGKHRFRVAPDWAKPVLLRMQERGIVEVNDVGDYRLKPMPKSDKPPKPWISPQLTAILKKSGPKFDHVIREDDEADAYYNSL